jgi:hypothetical protein
MKMKGQKRRKEMFITMKHQHSRRKRERGKGNRTGLRDLGSLVSRHICKQIKSSKYFLSIIDQLVSFPFLLSQLF